MAKLASNCDGEERMAKNDVDYVMKKHIITKKKLESDLMLYDNRRQIRVGQVNNLLTALRAGKSFPPMAVNFLKGKYWVLDGNHRYEALKKYLAEKPNQVVILWFEVYTIDNPELVKKKFQELNAGIKPNSDDHLQQYANENPFLIKLMKRVDCCSIYGSTIKPLKARVLLTAYLNAAKKSATPRTYSSTELLNKCDDLGDSDIKVIKAFLEDYVYVFGKLVKSSIWMRTTIFQSIFRIWHQNKDKIPFQVMRSRLKRLINHPFVIEYSRIGGREAVNLATVKFCEILNRSSKSNVFSVEDEPKQTNRAVA